MTSNIRRARVAGIETHWLEAGEGPPVVLLHGLGASSYSWRGVLPELSRSCRVIAPDWPGFGRSQAPSTHDYSIAGQSRWLCAFLDNLGAPAASLAGNSMGGAIALMTAMDAPARVRRLALLGVPIYAEAGPRVLDLLRWPVVGKVCEFLLIRPAAVRFVGRVAYKDPSVMTPDVVDEYSLSLRRPEGRRAVAQFLRRPIPPDMHERMKRYSELGQEILMVCGDSDGILSLSDARRFCREAPKARLLELAACGHVAQEERPGLITRTLAEFFA